MKVSIKIDSQGNDAFADGNELQETAKILRQLANRLEAEYSDVKADSKVLLDTNGQSVGVFTITR